MFFVGLDSSDGFFNPVLLRTQGLPGLVPQAGWQAAGSMLFSAVAIGVRPGDVLRSFWKYSAEKFAPHAAALQCSAARSAIWIDPA